MTQIAWKILPTRISNMELPGLPGPLGTIPFWTQRTVRSVRILMHRTRLTPTKHIRLQTMLRELRHEREAIKLLRWEPSLRNWPNFSRIKFSWRSKPKRLNASWRGLTTSTSFKHLNYSTKTKKATSNRLNFCMDWSTSPRSNATES